MSQPPEPRGPGPPHIFLENLNHSATKDGLKSLEINSTSLFYERANNMSSENHANKTFVKNGWGKTINNSSENNNTNIYLQNEPTKRVWTMETLQKVKNVVDSVLRAIGSTGRTKSDEKQKTLEDESSNDKDYGSRNVFNNNQRHQRTKISSRSGRKRKIKTNFNFKKRKSKRKNNSKLKLKSQANSFVNPINGESQKGVIGTKRLEESYQTPSNKFNHSYVSVKKAQQSNSTSSTLMPKVGAISSVTDLLFTVPNLSIIKPIENSQVEGAIKSTEKLVRTSLTDLLYNVPIKPKTNTNISSDSNHWDRQAKAEAAPLKAVEVSEKDLNKSTEFFAGDKLSSEMILQSSCIPVGSKGRFAINEHRFLVVGKPSLANRKRDCWEEVTRIVEKYIKVPSLNKMDFMATAAFYFVATTANLMSKICSFSLSFGHFLFLFCIIYFSPTYFL